MAKAAAAASAVGGGGRRWAAVGGGGEVRAYLLLTTYLGRGAHVADERRREQFEGTVHKGEGRVGTLVRAPFLAVVCTEVSIVSTAIVSSN